MKILIALLITASLYAAEYATLDSYAEYSQSSGLTHNYYFQTTTTDKYIVGRSEKSSNNIKAQNKACKQLVTKVKNSKKISEYCTDLQALQAIYDTFKFKVVSSHYSEVKYDNKGYSLRTTYTLLKE